MKFPITMGELLRDGYTEKLAKAYLKTLAHENNNPAYDPAFVKWAHEHGFYAECASILHLTEENCDNYLSQYEFNKVWPLNGWTRMWVNDKLTLKYTLSGGGLDHFLPKYYYYSTNHGLRVLMDNFDPEASEQALLRCLQRVGTFACKPSNGTMAAGFCKLSWERGQFCMNDNAVSETEVIDFVRTHPNYVFTEYLRPDDDWARYSPLIHTIRIMVLNEHGDDPCFVGNYIRIPYEGSGTSNYISHDGTNNDDYNIYALIDMETGEYGDAIAAYPDRADPLACHPDTGVPIHGTIRCLEEMKKASLDIARWFNTLEYFGIDFGITTEGLKIMEINTHPMVTISQIKNPLYKDARAKAYFQRKLREIDSMSEAEKEARNRILR